MTIQAKHQTNGAETPDDFQRWTAKRKAAVVMEIIKGKTTPADVARKQGNVTVGEIEKWVDEFQKAGEERMRSRPRDLEAQFEAEKQTLHAKIGELTLMNDALKKRNRILGIDEDGNS
jgi:transposase-like protein